ncbi:MAG: acylneuraminate cytidylyltransferase [uncultured bacterium]|nr:MAG: acylneuraminate cytidylyltransferase [uncultured bacterium]
MSGRNSAKVFKKAVKNIQLIAYDFDGVMTNNKVVVSENGSESVVVNRSDELGIKRIRAMGIPQIILSSGDNAVAKVRAKKIGLEITLGCQNKKDYLKEYCAKNNYDLKNVIYIGNDLNDIETLKTVGYPVAPFDAYPEVLKVVKYITKAKGGEGVIRELYGYFIA